jgi:hypothetical protein
MVLTPGYIKIIAAEIGSQIIAELRKPFKKSSGKIGAVKTFETAYSDKDPLVDCSKFHDQRVHEEIEKESAKG